MERKVDHLFLERKIGQCGQFLLQVTPYLTRHIKRYGDYVVNLQNIPQPFEGAILLPPEIFET